MKINFNIKVIKIKIYKPIYQTDDYYAVGIYDRRVKEAIKNGEMIEVETMGKKKVFSPKYIKEKCEKIKKVYLIPDKPMTEYVVFIPKKEEEINNEKDLEELAKKGIFG